MARFNKVTFKVFLVKRCLGWSGLFVGVDCMVIGLVKRCLRMVGTILRIIQMFAKNVKIDVRMIKLSSGLSNWLSSELVGWS